MYQPSHHKYRPKTFASILGQDNIVTTLKNALKFNRIAHAYLFCGSRGTGKTTLARLFAKALNCLTLTPDQEPCNVCPSCSQINEGRSLDVIEIDGASNRGIDDIRQLNETIGYVSSSGQYKIYIIDEVHMLTKEAFNALLKTLEEPPKNVKFFFATTEPHKVLPTIISRCQRFDLSRISTSQICKKLKFIAQDLGISIQEDAYNLIAQVAEGGLRDAESLLDQLICYSEGPITYETVSKILGLSPKSYFFKLDQAIDKQDFAFAFDLAKEIFSTGKDLACFVENLMEHFRVHLLYKLGLPLSSYLSESDQKSYLETSSFYTQEQCFSNLDFLMQWNKDLAKIPFKRLSLEMMILHLIRSKNKITIPTLVRRLEELSSSPKEAPSAKEPIFRSESNPASLVPHSSQPSIAEPFSLSPVSMEEEKEDLSYIVTPSTPLTSETKTPSPSKETQNLKPSISLPHSQPLSSPTPSLSSALSEQEKDSSPNLSLTSPLVAEDTVPSASKKVNLSLDPLPSENPSQQKSENPLSSSPGRHEVLLRFASVELEGTLIKE